MRCAPSIGLLKYGKSQSDWSSGTFKGTIMRTQLLCTFTRQTRFNETIDIIISCNEILYEKIYVFQNQQDLTQLICTYNVEFIDNFEENIENTISLHRKKQSNTLYTINGIE